MRTAREVAALSLAEIRSRERELAVLAREATSSMIRRSALVALRRAKSPLARELSVLILAGELRNQNLRETAIRTLGEVGTAQDEGLLQILQSLERARFGPQAARNAISRLRQRIGSFPSSASVVDATFSPRFDVALSFAGEDRATAVSIAQGLRNRGLVVFYDRFYEAELLGADLATTFGAIYKRLARFVIAIISRHYPRKAWTTFELANAQGRSIEQGGGYIVPARIDDTEVDGLSSSIGYFDLAARSIEELCALMHSKCTRGVLRKK